MIIGIKFSIHNDWNTYLAKILYNIACERYKFFVVDEYNQVFNKALDFLFQDNLYDGTMFSKLVSEYPYYTVSVKLQAYFHDYNSETYEIHDYSDFRHSECQFVIKVIDNIYVDIYSKNPEDIKIFYDNAMLFSFSDVELITENNCS